MRRARPPGAVRPLSAHWRSLLIVGLVTALLFLPAQDSSVQALESLTARGTLDTTPLTVLLKVVNLTSSSLPVSTNLIEINFTREGGAVNGQVRYQLDRWPVGEFIFLLNREDTNAARREAYATFRPCTTNLLLQGTLAGTSTVATQAFLTGSATFSVRMLDDRGCIAAKPPLISITEAKPLTTTWQANFDGFTKLTGRFAADDKESFPQTGFSATVAAAAPASGGPVGPVTTDINAPSSTDIITLNQGSGMVTERLAALLARNETMFDSLDTAMRLANELKQKLQPEQLHSGTFFESLDTATRHAAELRQNVSLALPYDEMTLVTYESVLAAALMKRNDGMPVLPATRAALAILSSLAIDSAADQKSKRAFDSFTLLLLKADLQAK